MNILNTLTTMPVIPTDVYPYMLIPQAA